MLNCSFTQRIPSQQCIGDSLRTINNNFSAIDAGLCDLPTVESGQEIEIKSHLDLLGLPKLNISTESAPVFEKEFSYSNLVGLSSLSFSDGTATQAFHFPYDGSPLNPKPFGTFETISNGTGSPQITLFWMGSSQNSLATVFATNSATSLNNKGPIWFNDTVDCFYKESDILYVGGQFTQVGGSTMRKFAAIDLNGGTNIPSLGQTGSILSSPLDVGGDLGSQGTVNFITKKVVDSNNLLIVGGSFNSITKGRSLVILNQSTGLFYPFYFNGELRDFTIIDNELYVVGEFDFCNYGASPAILFSGSQIFSRSVVKLDLNLLLTSPNSCIDEDFSANIENLFTKSTSLYCIEKQIDVLYIGGSFRIQSGTLTEYQNLIAIGLNALPRTTWKPIVDGPVYTMINDPVLSYLYIGGKFSTIAKQEDYYNRLVPLSDSSRFYNAAAFTLVDPSVPVLRDWKPKFNDAVHKMILHEVDDIDSYVYCAGAFTEVNDTSVGHICAIIKTSAVFDNQGALVPSWPVYLQTGFSPNTNALLKDTSSLLIGGNFTTVNQQIRYHFACVAGVNESPLITAPSRVYWNVGGQVSSQHQSFVLDFNTIPNKLSEVEVGPYGTINKTTFEPLQEGFKGLTKNQLCRFYIKRPGNSGVTNDGYQRNVFILGWTVNFNNK